MLGQKILFFIIIIDSSKHLKRFNAQYNQLWSQLFPKELATVNSSSIFPLKNALSSNTKLFNLNHTHYNNYLHKPSHLWRGNKSNRLASIECKICGKIANPLNSAVNWTKASPIAYSWQEIEFKISKHIHKHMLNIKYLTKSSTTRR